MRDRLKLITTHEPSEENVPFVIADGSALYEGEYPVIAYTRGQTFYILNEGGSDQVKLITCQSLKQTLDKYMFKGTKYIVSTYNPTLYYLFPGISENDDLFNSDNNFIPTLPISDIVRSEVDGFDPSIDSNVRGNIPPRITVGSNGNWYIRGYDTGRKVRQGEVPYEYIGPNGNWFVSFSNVIQEEVRSMKACDSWYNDLDKYEEIIKKIDERIGDIFGYYKEYDITKEVKEETGSYSVDLLGNSLVVSLISDTSYTDTINLEDWVLGTYKGATSISGKLDISYMYSIGGVMYGGMQTIKAFQYEENITSKNVIMNFGESCPVQIEYIDYILKIYPLSEEVDEVLFTDCTLTIGAL